MRDCDAFISYSHRADNFRATALQHALQNLGRPFYRRKNLNIFRDETSLSSNPGLWPSIERALNRSRYFVLMASPESAASPWCTREVEWWLANRSADTFLIVRSGGDLFFDDSAGDFDWTRTTALSTALRGRFPVEPFYRDLRWAQREDSLSLNNTRFRAEVLPLAAALHGKEPQELDGEDLRQFQRNRLFWRSAAAALALLTIISAAAAWMAIKKSREATRERDAAVRAQQAESRSLIAETNARKAEKEQRVRAEQQRRVADDQRRIADARRVEAETQRQHAEEERRIAVSRQLAAQSRDRLTSRLDLALLESVQATVVRDTNEARSSLLAALFYSPHLRKFLWNKPINVKTAAFSGDGRTLVELADDKRTVRVRSIDSNGIHRIAFVKGVAGVESIALNHDASRLALAMPHRIVIRNARSGAALTDVGLEGEWEVPGIAALGGNGTLAAYTSLGVRVWNLDTREPPRGPLQPKRWESALAFSPDASILASGAHDGSIVLWEVKSGQPIGSPLLGHERKIFSLAFSPDGHLLASGSEDRTIRLWDTTTRKLVHAPLKGHEPWPLGVETWGLTVAFSPDGSMLASAAKDGTVVLWDVRTGERLDRPFRGHPTGVVSVAFLAPTGRQLPSRSEARSLVSVGQDGTIIDWSIDPTTAAAATLGGNGDGVLGLTFSRNGRTLAAASFDGMVNLWNVDTRRPVESPLTGYGSAVLGIAFTNDDALLAATKEQLIDQPLGARAARSQRFTANDEPVSRIAFAPGGEAAAASDGSTLVLWDRMNRTFARLPVARASPTHEVTSLMFSPDGRLLASGGADGTVALWDVRRRRLLRPAIEAHRGAVYRGAVYALAFSPDGRTLASSAVGTADYDANVRLWNVATGAQLLPALSGHDGPVRALAFSRDGATLAVGELDGVVLWQLERRQRVGQPLAGHTGPIEALAFSPDGRWLASGGYDDRVLLWDLRLDSWRRLACAIANRTLDPTEWSRLVGDAPYQPACRSK